MFASHLIQLAGVLTATVGMMNHTVCLTRTGCLTQGTSHQLGIVAARETVPQDSFRTQIYGNCQIAEALSDPNIGRIRNPHLISALCSKQYSTKSETATASVPAWVVFSHRCYILPCTPTLRITTDTPDADQCAATRAGASPSLDVRRWSDEN